MLVNPMILRGIMLSLISFFLGIRRFAIEDYQSERQEKISNFLYSGLILLALGLLNYQIFSPMFENECYHS